MSIVKIVVLLIGIYFFILPLFSIQLKADDGGCCSHHRGKGFCDQAIGYWICKDGTQSPSCTCSKINTVSQVDTSFPSPSINTQSNGTIVGVGNSNQNLATSLPAAGIDGFTPLVLIGLSMSSLGLILQKTTQKNYAKKLIKIGFDILR